MNIFSIFNLHFYPFSVDDGMTESICERLVDLATLSGKAGLQQCRESTVLSLCVATLPPHYGYAVLKGTIGTWLGYLLAYQNHAPF